MLFEPPGVTVVDLLVRVTLAFASKRVFTLAVMTSTMFRQPYCVREMLFLYEGTVLTIAGRSILCKD